MLYKALLHRLISDTFDIFSSNFYQHHNFYNRLMFSPRKNDVTYSINSNNSQARVTVGCEFTRLQWLSLAFCKFRTRGQIRHPSETRRHGGVFSIIELFSLPVPFSLLKYFLWEKYCNYPLTRPCKYWEHRFLVPDLGPSSPCWMFLSICFPPFWKQ